MKSQILLDRWLTREIVKSVIMSEEMNESVTIGKAHHTMF